MSLEDIKQEIEKDLASDLLPEEIRKKYLGKKGKLLDLMKTIKDQPVDQRADYGKQLNDLKKYLEEALENREAEASTDATIGRSNGSVDVTAPFDNNTPLNKRPIPIAGIGHTNPLTQELDIVLDIFQSMGFEVMEARQLDDDYHMFGSLNFPDGHPARDMWDTFWTDTGLVVAAHTSTMQNRAYKTAKGKFPIKTVIPGSCYRREATDASHEHTLMQIEGVYVDKNVSIGSLTGVITEFLREYYQVEPEIKLQPAYFPFVEPGMEFCMACPFCGKTGCPTCGNKGWIELMGCGMIHPNVLKEGGIDTKIYNGFAWGMGIDRLTMLKTKINEIRMLRSGNIDFLEQF